MSTTKTIYALARKENDDSTITLLRSSYDHKEITDLATFQANRNPGKLFFVMQTVSSVESKIGPPTWNNDFISVFSSMDDSKAEQES